MDKKSLREYMKQLRNSTGDKQKQSYDEIIFKTLISDESYKAAQTIFVYVSFGSEVETHKVIEHALKHEKNVCVPKVINRNEGMKAIQIWSFEELKTSNYGILEPANINCEIKPENIDFVLAPGLLFDMNGGRLGYGAGYYDRFLKSVRKDCVKIGAAYHFQIVEHVPMEEHDVFLDRIITD
jgi:5-formyltetrahydrofolate cyclo-ligase